MSLDNPHAVVAALRAASLHLDYAHTLASESEGDATGLTGRTGDLILGLNSAVDALAGMIDAGELRP